MFYIGNNKGNKNKTSATKEETSKQSLLAGETPQPIPYLSSKAEILTFTPKSSLIKAKCGGKQLVIPVLGREAE